MDQTNFRASTGGVSPYSNTGSVSKSQDIEGMTMTQGVTQPKKNWKTSVKEFFRGVEKFFKSLTQRKATVGTPKTPTSVSKTKGKGVSHAPMVGGGWGLPTLPKAPTSPCLLAMVGPASWSWEAPRW